MKRSALKRGTSALKRTGLRHTAPGDRARANGIGTPRRSVSSASTIQREKAAMGCRVHGAACGNSDPMHIVDRSIGGCDDPLCVIGACRAVHELYDAHQYDILPYLSLEEQAHAVGHLGLLRALRRVTGETWTVKATRFIDNGRENDGI